MSYIPAFVFELIISYLSENTALFFNFSPTGHYCLCWWFSASRTSSFCAFPASLHVLDDLMNVDLQNNFLREHKWQCLWSFVIKMLTGFSQGLSYKVMLSYLMVKLLVIWPWTLTGTMWAFSMWAFLKSHWLRIPSSISCLYFLLWQNTQ